jgi:hypothetical protein
MHIFDTGLSQSRENNNNTTTLQLNSLLSPNSPRRLLKFKGALINPPKSRRPQSISSVVYTNKELIAKVNEETMLSRREQQVDEGKTEMAENSYIIKCD